jgi:hypothetical protein
MRKLPRTKEIKQMKTASTIDTFNAGRDYALKNEPAADYEILSALHAAALTDSRCGLAPSWNAGVADGYWFRMGQMDISRRSNAPGGNASRFSPEQLTAMRSIR